jgi:ABC-2 type transport system ATP-binding protein
MPRGEAVLELSEVCARIGNRYVLRDVSARLVSGAWYGLAGPNGSGKTTLMRAALGLLRPVKGTVRLFGKLPPVRPGMVGVAFGPRNFHPRRKASTELSLRVRGLGGDKEAEARAWADSGLDDARARCGDLSLGQSQRLSIACALALAPPLLVLDEPSTGLDATAVDWLRNRLMAHVREGGCVWVSTHDLGELGRCADEIMVLDKGTMVCQGPIETGTGESVRIRSTSTASLVEALESEGIQYRHDDDAVVTEGASPERIGKLLAARGVPVTMMVMMPPRADRLAHGLRAEGRAS